MSRVAIYISFHSAQPKGLSRSNVKCADVISRTMNERFSVTKKTRPTGTVLSVGSRFLMRGSIAPIAAFGSLHASSVDTRVAHYSQRRQRCWFGGVDRCSLAVWSGLAQMGRIGP